MNIKATDNPRILLLIAILAWPAGPAFSTDTSAEVKAPAGEGDSALMFAADLAALDLPPELLEELNKMAQKSNASMQEVNALLEQDIAAVKDADKVFDRMIQTIRDAAQQGGPQSKLVAQIDQLAASARTDAADARQNDMEDLEAIFTQQAAAFEEAKAEAIGIYTGSFRKIREIEREKKRFVLAMRAKRYSLALQNVRKGLEVLKGLDAQIASVYDKLPSRDVQAE
jgi:hypothetical protein